MNHSESILFELKLFAVKFRIEVLSRMSATICQGEYNGDPGVSYDNALFDDENLSQALNLCTEI